MRAFKDSGIEWLGEIPEHWEVVTLKYLVEKIIGGGTPDTSNLDYWTNNKKDGYLWVSIEDITKSSFITDTKRYITQDGLESSSAKLIPPFSILYSIYASLGKIAYSDQILTTNQAILGIQSNHKLVFYKFLFYCLCNTTNYVTILSSMTTQNNISLSVVANLKIPVPPLEEQKAIADFLDSKCTQIDNFCEKKQKLITLLNEKKQSLINECVTKGLDKNVTFKDSGIEHLGEIPKHWEVKRLATFGRFSKGGNISRQDLAESGDSALLYGDIYMNYEISTSCLDSKISKNTSLGAIPIYKGDILFAGSGETKEDIGKNIVYLGKDKAFAGGDVIIFRQKGNNVLYLSYSLNTRYAKFCKGIESKGEIIVHIYASNLKDIKIPLPPLKEQEQIAQFLDSKISKIDKIIEKTKKQIKLIKEYKTTLINQAVCGRINL
ncbi:MAG: restriction endonuclease subunit S [Helicobacter sp.]|nr:restriction endonuclease subunit S [Helicobacter sp.]